MQSPGATFHGRDVFAPAAAHLANGVPLGEFGPEVKDCTSPLFSKPTLRADKELIGEVLHIDDFGNLITNITRSDLVRSGLRLKIPLDIRLKGTLMRLSLCKTYGEAPLESALTLVGSHDFLEIAVNQGNASRMLKVKVGDAVVVSQA